MAVDSHWLYYFYTRSFTDPGRNWGIPFEKNGVDVISWTATTSQICVISQTVFLIQNRRVWIFSKISISDLWNLFLTCRKHSIKPHRRNTFTPGKVTSRVASSRLRLDPDSFCEACTTTRKLPTKMNLVNLHFSNFKLGNIEIVHSEFNYVC